jgi:hypothetical protein
MNVREMILVIMLMFTIFWNITKFILQGINEKEELFKINLDIKLNEVNSLTIKKSILENFD